MKLHVVLEPSEEGGYTVIVPSLPGCVSEGETREEALRNVREAVELYLEPVEDDLAAYAEAELFAGHLQHAAAEVDPGVSTFISRRPAKDRRIVD